MPADTEEQAIDATQLMGADTVSRTAIMPPALIADHAADLGMSEEPYAARRQRRRIGIALLASVVALLLVVQLAKADDSPLPAVTTTSTPAIASATTVAATAQSPTTVPAPTTVPVPITEPGRGKKDKPPKDKPHP